MSKKLVNVLDHSLLPFALTILAKCLGLYLALSTYNVDWGLSDFPNSLITVTPIVYGRDLVSVSTYSNLVLFVVMFVAFGFQIMLSKIRYSKNISSSLLLRIMSIPQLNLWQRGWQLYSRVYVWLVYMWLIVIYIAVDSILGRTELWLLVLSLALNSLATMVVFSDTNKEFESLKKVPKTLRFS